MMKTTLPKPIATFINATNNFDCSALMAILAEDALVNDTQREFWGVVAIKKFIDREIIGAKVTMEVVKVTEHYGDYIVSAKIDGAFDKSNLPDPLILDYYFTLRDDKVTKLIILHNKPAE